MKTVHRIRGQCSLNLIGVKILFVACILQTQTNIHKKIVTNSGTNTENEIQVLLFKKGIVRLFSNDNTMPSQEITAEKAILPKL